MGKNELFSPSSIKSTRKEIHPIWRGIGFIFIILIPVLSYIGALVLMEENAKKRMVSDSIRTAYSNI